MYLVITAPGLINAYSVNITRTVINMYLNSGIFLQNRLMITPSITIDVTISAHMVFILRYVRSYSAMYMDSLTADEAIIIYVHMHIMSSDTLSTRLFLNIALNISTIHTFTTATKSSWKKPCLAYSAYVISSGSPALFMNRYTI